MVRLFLKERISSATCESAVRVRVGGHSNRSLRNLPGKHGAYRACIDNGTNVSPVFIPEDVFRLPQFFARPPPPHTAGLALGARALRAPPGAAAKPIEDAAHRRANMKSAWCTERSDGEECGNELHCVAQHPP